MVSIVKDINIADGITHSGTMHADEVFATAFLGLYFKDFKVIRVLELEKNYPNKIIYDIFNSKFDHHSSDAKIRSNGIKYSSFGLLIEEYLKDYLKKNKVENVNEVYDYFVNDFVLAIDAIDNGVFPKVEALYKVKTVSDIIKLFNPTYLSDDDSDSNFLKAVNLATIILKEELKNVISKIMAFREVVSILDKTKGDVLILSKYLPYEEVLLNNKKYDNIKFCVYPSNRGGYAAKTIPISLTDRNSRVYFSKKWAGLKDEELVKITNVLGATFCHNNRFLVTAKTFNDIMKLVEITLREENVNE